MLYDMELATKEADMESKGGKGNWRRAGEGINDARDRIRREREENKRRLGVV